jgi:hypothetical protein
MGSGDGRGPDLASRLLGVGLGLSSWQCQASYGGA